MTEQKKSKEVGIFPLKNTHVHIEFFFSVHAQDKIKYGTFVIVHSSHFYKT